MDFFVSPEWNQQVLDDNGNPAFGWKIYTYIAGSTTPIDTYTDATGNTTNPNPIILPADGRYELWLEQDVAYKIVLTDENDVSRKTVDNVVGGIQGSGGGGLDFVSVAQSDTISLDGLGTVALPLTATVNISSISSQAITITTGGIYARDYGIEISDLETAVANKLDKVQTAGQNVVSSVDFEKGIQLELGYFGTGSPQLFFGTATDAYIHKQPNGDLVVINQPGSGNNGGLGIRTVPATSKVETDVAAGNNNLTITEGDATTPAVMRFELFDEGGGKEYFFDAVDTNNSPTKIYGRDASNKLVEVDPTFISSVAWGDITGNIANQPDVNLQSVTDNGPATTNAIQTGDITVTTPAAGGESLKLPDFSWIQPLNSNTGLFITNHTSPAPSGGGSIHIDNGVNLYSGNGTVIQSQIGCDPSAGVFLASYDLAGIVAANIQLAPNDIQILSQAGSQIIANGSNLTLQGPASQSLEFNSSNQAFFAAIPTGTPIQDPVQSYYYYEDPIAGELKKTTFGVFKNLVQASDQSQTNFIAMNFTGGSGGTGSLISSDRMDIQSFGVMNILPGNVTPIDGQVLTYSSTVGGLTYDNQTTILLKSTGNTADRTTEIQNALNNASYVYLGAGDFYMDGTVKMPSNTALLGIPGATKIIRGSTQDNLLRNNNTASGLYSGNENIFVQGIIFDTGAGATPCTPVAFGHCSNITVADCGFTQIYSWHGIEYNACTNSTILNCKFYDFQGVDADEEMIQLDNMGTTGRWPWDTATTVYDGTPCTNISISNCSFQNGSTGIGSHSYEAGNLHSNISIDGCTFDSLTSYGIRDVTGELYTISNCTFDTIGLVGIAHLNNPTNDWTITGCTFSNMTLRAIQMAYVTGLSISSNVINTTVSHAIGFDYCDTTTVTNNSIVDCEDVAIYCFRSLHSTISNNVVKGGGSNQSSTEADITVGSSISVGANTQDTIVTGNYCNDINTRQYSTRTVVENNIFVTSTTNTTSTEYREVNNFIGGVWESGSADVFTVNDRLLVGGATDDLVNSLQVDSSIRVGDTTDTTDNFINIYSLFDQSTGIKYREWDITNSFGFDTYYDGTTNKFNFDAVESNLVTGTAMSIDRGTRVVSANERLLVGGSTDDLINDLQVDGSVRVGDTTDTSPNFVNIYAGNAQSMGVQYREWNGANSFGFNNYYDGSTNTFNFDAVESNVVTGNVMRLSRSSRRLIIENSIEVPKLDNVPTGSIAYNYGEDSSGNLVKSGQVLSFTNPATLTPDASTTKQVNANAQAQALTINVPTNPTDGAKVIYRIRATATSALTWSASFVDLRGTLPTSAPINKTIYVGAIYNAFTSSWEIVSVVEQA